MGITAAVNRGQDSSLALAGVPPRPLHSKLIRGALLEEPLCAGAYCYSAYQS
jgi:hypothetical protein